MNTLYFDHATTSFPKAGGVGEAMERYIRDIGCSVGRGAYAPAYEAASGLLELREILSALFGGPGARNVIFTPGATHSLNYVLKGLLRPGDLCLTSAMEHNAVLRPLRQMEACGVRTQILPCGSDGALLPGWEEQITPSVRLVVLTHASNVCGTLLPAAAVGRHCRRQGVFFCLDAAQTAGSVPIDMAEMGVDALAFPGHKALRGPQGIGGLLLSDALAAELTPLISGGTGSFSDVLDPPHILPDRFEAGTPNLPGAFGLLAAVRPLTAEQISLRRVREVKLTGHLLARLREMEPDGLRVLGGAHAADRVGVVSVDFPALDNAEAAYRLEQEYGILTRCGLHCAPMAHQTLGTFPAGAVRFSVGPDTRFEDIDFVHGAVCAIMGV